MLPGPTWPATLHPLLLSLALPHPPTLSICHRPTPAQVYAAEWHSTAVAVKMLHQEPSTTGSGSLSSGGGSSLNSNLAAAASLLAKLQEEADIMLRCACAGVS